MFILLWPYCFLTRRAVYSNCFVQPFAFLALTIALFHNLISVLCIRSHFSWSAPKTCQIPVSNFPRIQTHFQGPICIPPPETSSYKPWWTWSPSLQCYSRETEFLSHFLFLCIEPVCIFDCFSSWNLLGSTFIPGVLKLCDAACGWHSSF